MLKKIMTKTFAMAALLMASFFANAQQTERLPVVATPEEKLLNNQLQKQAKSGSPASKTPWLISRKQVVSTLSPAPANVLVNNNNGATATGQFTQSETTILAYGNNVITGFNDAGSTSGGANRFTGYAYSTDGGLTFTDAGNLPASAGGDAGDPVLARNNTTGRIYFATLGYTASTIQLFRSDDNGLTWLPPVNATPGGNNEDKQWMTVDNYAGGGNGNVYLMSRRFGGTVGIYFHRSTDDGSTFSPGILLFAGGQGAFVEVDPAHNIYAFYINSSGSILMRKSTDQGLTFAPAITVSTYVGGVNGDQSLTGLRQGTATYASLRSNAFPHVAINPVSGHIYVTHGSNPAGVDKADVFMVMSTDGGATWSVPVRVNDDITTTDQWQPTIAVSPDGLNLGIFYYSRQEDPLANNLFKYYCRTAAISGASVNFRPSGPVSDVAAIPEFGRDNVVNSTYMGDYQQAAATANGFYVTWADSRSDLAIGPPRKDPNVYFAKVPLEGVAGTSVLVNTTAPVISGGNGNATIEVNECNSISISLTNLGSVAAQGINAVITSSTPGVVITQGNSAYPDLAPAASAVNSTAFTIATSTGYICGTNVQLTLTVTTSDGTVVFNFVLPASSSVGAPVSFSNNTVTPIPDLATTNIPITVSGISSSIGKVTLSLYFTHTFDSDLSISLIGPDGTTVQLSANNGGSGDNYGSSCDPVTSRTTFDDAAATSITAGAAPFVGTFIPQQSLAAFNGKSGANVNGIWTLRIVDAAGGDLGSFNCVTINISENLPCANDGPPITCPANITDGVNPVTYTVGTASNGPVTLSYVFTGATTGSGSGTGSGSTFNVGITTVTVTSSNGCLTSSCSFTVEVTCSVPVITAPTVTQPTCISPTGTIAVNATGAGTLEYSVDNGTTWQASATFSGLAAGNYNIKVRPQATPACESTYDRNPVVIHATESPSIGIGVSGPLTFCEGESVNLTALEITGYYLKVITPYAINFNAGIAGFGANILSSPVTGDMVYIPDGSASYLGCSPYTPGSLNGKVALIDRGTCTFVLKVKNAQDAGAIAVIIVNNVAGGPINMGGSDPTITIPVISVSQSDGVILKNMIAQGTTNGNSLQHTFSYLWSNGATTEIINVTQSGNYSLQTTDENGCSSSFGPITVTVNPVPVAVATPAAQSSCTGNAITTIVLSGGASGTVYNWTRDNLTVTGIAANGSGNISGTLTNTSASPVTVTFTITPSYTNAGVTCTGTPVTATVTVNPVQYFACPANMTETINDVICFKAVNTPNPVFCGTLTKLTWKLTGATTLSSPTSGINYLGLRNMNVGTTTVTYTATFTGGVVKTCSFTVLVIETIPPNIRCPLDKDVNTDPGKCYKTGPVSLGTPVVSDNCGIASITNDAPAVYQKGVNLVTWTVTDKSGNTRTCVQRVTVYDKETPVIVCPANVIVNAGTGPNCNATQVTLPNPVFTDNCEVVTLKWAMTGVTYGSSNTPGINYVPTMDYAVGVSTVTYTAIDAAGNAKTCTFTVTVKDVTAPTLVCPAAQTLCKVANNTYTIPPMVQSDNCVIISTTYKITGATSRTGSGTNASGLFNLGVSTITWTVKDSHGNTSTCTTVVTVVATSNPICTPPPPITFAEPGISKKFTEVEAAGLSITAWPNPTVNYFNLKVNTAAKETVVIRMYDMAGKLVQVKNGAPGQTYILGENVMSGMYIIEVSQGANKQKVKLVKLN